MRRGLYNRRGSALLIVLGMLAFMVISAVAFSAYMRASRLPSSFLRRTSASRLLVKAALAEAIEEIDVAVGDNPHPGVTVSTNSAVSGYKYYYPRYNIGSTAQNRNWWKGRVYIGTNSLDGIDAQLKIAVPQRDTVPTLTLEGLAYIPPPLINEARYYSRHSTAGKWHYFPYDSGRYAFTAIDVSDYFDVNAVPADGRRTSAPEDRITLSYLFPDKAAGMGSFMKQLCDNKLPLVSLADWNLAINYDQSYGIRSPFCEYIKNPNVDFYGSYGNQEELRKMTFVTDSWFPPAADTGVSKDKAEIDLSEEGTQPFEQFIDRLSFEVGYEEVVGQTKNDTIDRLREFLPQGGLAALYDYLDFDSVPFSLSLPTTERTPMICGVKPTLSGTAIEIESEDETKYGDEKVVSATEKQRVATRTVIHKLKGGLLGAMNVDPMIVYPFRGQESDIYELDGRLALFFTTGEMGLRPGNCIDPLRIALDKDGAKAKANPVQDGVWTFPLAPQQVKFNAVQDMVDMSAAVKDAGLTLELNGNALSAVDEALEKEGKFLESTFVWEQRSKKDPETGAWTAFEPDFEKAMADPVSCGMDAKSTSTFRALNPDGSLNGDFKATGDALLQKLKDGIALKLNLAVWLRLKGKTCKNGVNNDKTVDLVPASVADDAFNNSPNAIDMVQGQGIADNFGNMTPLMRFDTGVSFTFKITETLALETGVAGAKGVTLTPEAAMIGDPRFNYAPENWYQAAAGDFTGTMWLNKCHVTEGDGDIFLQVSDQRYLQSVYELANLPRLGKDGLGSGIGSDAGSMPRPETWSSVAFPTHGNEVNREYMWKSYDPFGRYDSSGSLHKGNQAKRNIRSYPAVGNSTQTKMHVGDGFEALGIVNRGIGFKINPYSDSTNVMMAAFANTPHDWRSASPDNEDLPKTANAFNSEYTWDEYSSKAPRLKDVVLEEFAGALMQDIRDPNVRPKGCESKWEAAFQQLGWWGDSEIEGAAAPDNLIAGIPTGGDKIYNNERKFLYGYWRECFAVKQQLFLIFVRAEPTMMGSGAMGKTPPQLGGRAVALVWRDPNAAAGEGGAAFTSASEQGVAVPHKTRILFYHTLE